MPSAEESQRAIGLDPEFTKRRIEELLRIGETDYEAGVSTQPTLNTRGNWLWQMRDVVFNRSHAPVICIQCVHQRQSCDRMLPNCSTCRNTGIRCDYSTTRADNPRPNIAMAINYKPSMAALGQQHHSSPPAAKQNIPSNLDPRLFEKVKHFREITLRADTMDSNEVQSRVRASRISEGWLVGHAQKMYEQTLDIKKTSICIHQTESQQLKTRKRTTF